MKLNDLIGRKFGKLAVLKRGPDSSQCADLRVQWICKCECGALDTIISRYLTRGERKQCNSCREKRGGDKHDGLRARYGANADKWFR